MVTRNPFVCVSIPVGQPDPNSIANANLDPPTPADREVSIHDWRLVIVPCGLVLCACRTRAAVCVCGAAGFKNGGFSQQTARLFWLYLFIMQAGSSQILPAQADLRHLDRPPGRKTCNVLSIQSGNGNNLILIVHNSRETTYYLLLTLMVYIY